LKEAAFNLFNEIKTDYNGFMANAALAFLVGTSLYSYKRWVLMYLLKLCSLVIWIVKKAYSEKLL